MKTAAITALLFSLGSLAPAQMGKESSANTANPIVTTVRQMEGHYAKNLTGAADEMPADKYSYRPTPEQITFAHLMMHIAESNNMLCAAAARNAPAAKLSETDSKEVLSHALKDSFAYCEQVLEKADDSTLARRPLCWRAREHTWGGVGESGCRLGRPLLCCSHVLAIE